MSLAVIAYEEAAKSWTLLFLYADQADEKARKKVWERYLSHTHKASGLGLKKDDLDSFFENDQEIYKRLQDAGKTANKQKQLGFYADIYEHEGVDFWMSPSEFVSSDMAKMVVEGISAKLSSQLDESLIQQRQADVREHVRAMDQHPRVDVDGRWAALVESLAKADFEAAKRKKIRELLEETEER